jgi:hypothetical protein
VEPDWLTQLSIFSVVIMDQKLGLLIKTGVSNLLLHPSQCWVLSDVKMCDFSASKLHDDEDIQNTKTDRVLNEEITGPDDFSLILQKGAPALRVFGASPSINPILPDGRWGVPDAEFQFQLQGNSVFTVLRMIR